MAIAEITPVYMHILNDVIIAAASGDGDKLEIKRRELIKSISNEKKISVQNFIVETIFDLYGNDIKKLKHDFAKMVLILEAKSDINTYFSDNSFGKMLSSVWQNGAYVFDYDLDVFFEIYCERFKWQK